MLEMETSNGIVKVRDNSREVTRATVEDICIAGDIDLSNHIHLGNKELESGIDNVLLDFDDISELSKNHILSASSPQKSENNNDHSIFHDVVDRVTNSPWIDAKVETFWAHDEEIYSQHVTQIIKGRTLHELLHDDRENGTLNKRIEAWKYSSMIAVWNNVAEITDQYFNREFEGVERLFQFVWKQRFHFSSGLEIFIPLNEKGLGE